MEHADTAQLAALGGALGSVLVLLGRGRLPLLAGLVLLAAAELGLAWALGGGPLDRLSGASGAAAVALALVALGAATALFVQRPAIVPDRACSWPRRCGRRCRSTARARCSCRSPTTAASAGCCRSTSCSRRRLRRWLAGAARPRAAPAAEAGGAARPRRSSPSRAARSCGPTTWRRARTCCCSSRCRSWRCSPRSRARASRPGRRAAWPPPRSRSPPCSRLVGLWQAATHELFFYAPNLAASNANTDYFRVTSLFGDPSLYGRHVVLGIGVALTLLATRRWRPWPLIGLHRGDVGRAAVLVLAVEHGRAARDHPRARRGDRRPARAPRRGAAHAGGCAGGAAATSPCRWRTGSP